MKTFCTTILRVVVFVFIVALSTSVISVYAQTNKGGQALEIGPPIVVLRGDPGAQLRAQISLRDVSNNKLLVTNEINDFTANGEGGAAKLLIKDAAKPTPYSIIPWIKPLPEFTLVPKQIQKLDLNITIPQKASPGGYYGVIRFTGTPPDLEGSGVALTASIGTLVFIRVNGDANEKLSIVELSASELGIKGWLFDSTPLDISLRLNNLGNTFERPKAEVKITDMFGNLVTTMYLNDKKSVILPGSIRKFSDTLDKDYIGNKWLFGQYTAEVKVTYGDNNEKTITSKITIWIIHWKLILTVIIGLVALFFLIRIGLWRYKQRVLRQSSRGRRR